ncbi:hypothetical protein GJ496_007405 [Pomphorhynchus laevis]|nr:hypothetical protein GJ496_007405 [Pomphorhynchus laevis]
MLLSRLSRLSQTFYPVQKADSVLYKTVIPTFDFSILDDEQALLDNLFKRRMSVATQNAISSKLLGSMNKSKLEEYRSTNLEICRLQSIREKGCIAANLSIDIRDKVNQLKDRLKTDFSYIKDTMEQVPNRLNSIYNDQTYSEDVQLKEDHLYNLTGISMRRFNLIDSSYFTTIVSSYPETYWKNVNLLKRLYSNLLPNCRLSAGSALIRNSLIGQLFDKGNYSYRSVHGKFRLCGSGSIPSLLLP